MPTPVRRAESADPEDGGPRPPQRRRTLSLAHRYTLRECAYWMEELDVVVFAKPTDETLRVFDIVGPQVPSLAELLRRLPPFEVDQIEFMFIPDKLYLTSAQPLAGDDPDGTHIGGHGFPYEAQPFRFPFTAHA